MLKSTLGIAIAFSLCAVAHAANQGQSFVNFKGTVIDAPCGIDPDSADQTIDFGQISKSHLKNDGISVKKDLDIKLVNCDFTDPTAKKTVSVTFSGTPVNGHTAVSYTHLIRQYPLKLIGHANRDNIIIINIQFVIAIQLVDFIINKR